MIYDSPSPSLPSPCPSSSLKPSGNNEDCERASGFMLSRSGRASEPTIFCCHCSDPPPPSTYSPACQAPAPEKTLNASVNLGFRVSSSRFLSSALWTGHCAGRPSRLQSFHFMLLLSRFGKPPDFCALVNPSNDQRTKKEPLTVSCWCRADERCVVVLLGHRPFSTCSSSLSCCCSTYSCTYTVPCILHYPHRSSSRGGTVVISCRSSTFIWLYQHLFNGYLMGLMGIR